MYKKITLLIVATLAVMSLQAQFTRKDLQEAKKEFRQEKKQDWDIILDPIQRIFTTASDPSEIENWGQKSHQLLANIEEIKRRAVKPARIYIFDTAGDFDHPDLAQAKRPGAVFTGESSPADGHGHGTHVAGIIGALGSYKLGIAHPLVEKRLLELVPVKVLNNSGSGLFSWITAGTIWATKDAQSPEHAGKTIIFNFSLGGGGEDQALTNALFRAKEAGITIYAAAGNTHSRGVQNPGKDVSTHAVAALQQSGAGVEKAPYSTWGPEVFVAAAGSNIFSTIPGGQYRKMSGTSMASPTMAAVHALAASVFPCASSDQILAAIPRVSSDLPPTGRDENHGWGMPIITRILAENICDAPIPPKPEPPKPEPPKPEPPKQPTPVYPERTTSITIPNIYSITWRANNSTQFVKTPIQLNVQYTHRKNAQEAATEIYQLTNAHFASRGYILPNDADVQDAIYWAAYFYELILGRVDAKLNVKVSRISAYGTPELFLNDPVKKTTTYKRAMKAGAVAVDYDKFFNP